MGLGVLVDFHSAAGAQNEDAHSGLSNGEVKFWKDKNLRATSIALRFLASQLAGNPAVIGLELLNEPKDNQGLKDWYDREINELRPITNPDFPIYVSDAWVTDFYAGYVGSRGDFVVMDHHLYRCFTHEDKCMTGCQHADKLQQDQGQFAHWSQQCHNQWVVGEWSAALDDSGCQGMSDGEKDANKRAFVKAQLDCFDRHTAGYFFWTLKTDRPWDAGWSAQNAAQAEILPASVQKQIRTPDQGQRDGACHQATGEYASTSSYSLYGARTKLTPQTSMSTTGSRTTATRNHSFSRTASCAAGTTHAASSRRATRSDSGGRGRGAARRRSASPVSPRRGSGTEGSSRVSRLRTRRLGSTSEREQTSSGSVVVVDIHEATLILCTSSPRA